VPDGEYADDEILVKAIAARDAGAFAFLLETYHTQLTRLARQYVPSDAIADEVVQETWLAVIQGIDRFEQRSSLKTWLFRILLNTARTHGVKESRSIPAAMTLGDDDPAVEPSRFRRFSLRGRGQWKEPPQPWVDPERRAIDREMLDTIDAAIARLTPEQRLVITMRDVLGWTAVEVCDALDLSDANQRVLLHRARSKVRAALEREYAGGAL
jgi:RNA polymerase sigma-70 factor (ECF subfamily)